MLARVTLFLVAEPALLYRVQSSGYYKKLLLNPGVLLQRLWNIFLEASSHNGLW